MSNAVRQLKVMVLQLETPRGLFVGLGVVLQSVAFLVEGWLQGTFTIAAFTSIGFAVLASSARHTEAQEELSARLSVFELMANGLSRGARPAATTADDESDIESPRHQSDDLASARKELESSIAELASAMDTIREQVPIVAADARTVQHQITFLEQVQRAALVALRNRLSSLTERLYPQVTAVSSSISARQPPILSIAIPSFNRPDGLRTCIESVDREIGTHGENLIEVCITDDASTDRESPFLAHRFAIDHPFASFRANGANVGLERNLIAAAEACSGEYVLLLGNDDALTQGALESILGDLHDGAYDVYLYEKRRVDSGMRPMMAIEGSTPINIASGTAEAFESPLRVAERSGILSAFGFISQVVFRRRPFLAVDPTPYLGLTLYPQTGMIFEAFHERPVLYRNSEIALHRTLTQAEKRAEALGLREEMYMAEPTFKRAFTFGSRYAAFLERLIRRTSIRHADIAGLPERLFTRLPLVAWIEQNMRLAEDRGMTIGDAVASDAAAFLAGIAAVDSKRGEFSQSTTTGEV